MSQPDPSAPADPFSEGAVAPSTPPSTPTIPQVPVGSGQTQSVPIATSLWNRALDSQKGIRLEFPTYFAANRQRNNQYTARKRRQRAQGGATLWDDLSCTVTPVDPARPGAYSPHYLIIFKDTALGDLLARPVEDLP